MDYESSIARRHSFFREIFTREHGGSFITIRRIAEYLEDFDIVVGNLETPLTEKARTMVPKSAHIRATPSDASILKYLKISAVSLANNHMFDYGSTGYRDTIETLDRIGISWFGAEKQYFSISKNGGKGRFTGYCCYSTHPYGLRRDGKETGIEPFDPALVDEDISKAIDAGELPVVCVHAGQEHVHYPNLDHVDVARRMADKHRFVYCGHHPHVIQGIEERAGSLIAYSLGNFCFDDVRDADSGKLVMRQAATNKQSIILELEIQGANLLGWRANTDKGLRGLYRPGPEWRDGRRSADLVGGLA